VKTYSTAPDNERVKKIVCNICGSALYVEYLRIDSARFVKCSGCGLVYQNPQPVFDDLKRRYSEEYFNYEITNEKNFFNLMRLGLKDIDFINLTSNIKKINNTFLDIGCATGMLLESMRKADWEVKGVEICEASAEYGRREKKLDIYTGTLEQANYGNDAFSVIHFSHLIEHLNDPGRFLREVYRILKADGYAVITTPNVDGFQARILREKWRSAIPDHLYLFSKKTLHSLLKLTGFNILKTVTWGGAAKGIVPGFIKYPVDKMAKSFGFGDVVLFLASKGQSSA